MMNGKRIVACLLAFVMLAFAGCAGQTQTTTGTTATGQTTSSTTTTTTETSALTPRTKADRDDALAGKVVTPDNIPATFFQGIEKVGAVPAKKYFIAFSNGEMANSWSRALVLQMEEIAKKYETEFGIRFEWTNAGNNSTKQLSDIQSLLSKNPDLLIVDPNEVEPLDVVYDWCKQAGVPLITLDKQFARDPDETYISMITMDNYITGVAQGLAVVDYLTAKNGSPKGNVVEVAGILGASPSIYRSQGANLVFQSYPDIRVIASRAGEWDNTISYQVAQDIMTTFNAGSFDMVIGSSDDSNIVFMEAAKAMGRNELKGAYVGIDSPVTILEKMLAGEAYFSAEFTPYYGYFAFEYAIHYLNGENIPAVVSLPQRFFKADTAEKKEAIQKIVDFCKANKYEFVPPDIGYYDLFSISGDPRVAEIYPHPYWEDQKLTGGKYFDVPYYKTSDPIK